MSAVKSGVVMVVSITHARPSDPTDALEISPALQAIPMKTMSQSDG
jgi:hypothetical protein